MGQINVAIIGVGNCASSLVQGVSKYKEVQDNEKIPGLMHNELGGYSVGDINIVAAFDVDNDKVGKEEIMGLLTAVELWLERDHQAEWQVWLSRLDIISNKIKSIGGIETEIINPCGLSNRSPSLEIRWNDAI